MQNSEVNEFQCNGYRHPLQDKYYLVEFQRKNGSWSDGCCWFRDGGIIARDARVGLLLVQGWIDYSMDPRAGAAAVPS